MDRVIGLSIPGRTLCDQSPRAAIQKLGEAVDQKQSPTTALVPYTRPTLYNMRLGQSIWQAWAFTFGTPLLQASPAPGSSVCCRHLFLELCR